MKVVLNTNILISALTSKTAAPHHIYQAWRDKRLIVLSCAEQLLEVREVTRHELWPYASSLRRLAGWLTACATWRLLLAIYQK